MGPRGRKAVQFSGAFELPADVYLSLSLLYKVYKFDEDTADRVFVSLLNFPGSPPLTWTALAGPRTHRSADSSWRCRGATGTSVVSRWESMCTFSSGGDTVRSNDCLAFLVAPVKGVVDGCPA